MTSYSSSWMELKSKACVGWLVPHVSDILQSSRVGLHVWQRGPARGVPLFFHEKAGRRRAAALPFSVFSPAARISIVPFGGTTALSCCRPLLCCSILVVLRYAPRRTDRAWIHGAIHALLALEGVAAWPGPPGDEALQVLRSNPTASAFK